MNTTNTLAINRAYDNALNTIAYNLKSKNCTNTPEQFKKNDFSLYDAIGIAKDAIAIVEGRKSLGGIIDAVMNGIKKIKSWFK